MDRFAVDDRRFAHCFAAQPYRQSPSGFAALRSAAILAWYRTLLRCGASSELRQLAEHVRCAVARGTLAWNCGNGARVLRFFSRHRWLQRRWALGLQQRQVGTQEGEPIMTVGQMTPTARIDKPWGWELIGPIVRPAIGGAHVAPPTGKARWVPPSRARCALGDFLVHPLRGCPDSVAATDMATDAGYTYKMLLIVGPLSRQVHTPYHDATGTAHGAKVETQMCLGPDPYLIRTADALYRIWPGEAFHIPEGLWHQPTVLPGAASFVEEVSTPNIGPGSTTRDPDGDPWATQRSPGDQ
ncbi:MAG: hypothetical protein HYV02_05930 [Deltaproteobacteria bacterium]|nr:hypothetical protein [Deltaproteobacteria bacterium]